MVIHQFSARATQKAPLLELLSKTTKKTQQKQNNKQIKTLQNQAASQTNLATFL